MRRTTVGMFVVLLACGGSVEPAWTRDPGALPVATRDASTSLRTVEVPGGEVLLGEFGLDGEGNVVPAPPPVAPVRWAVRPFRLMDTEVTVDDFAACVAEGGCTGPASGEGSLPAGVSYFQARAFCRHHGGDLPTLAQWARAAQDDEASLGVSSLTASYRRCQALPDGGECERFRGTLSGDLATCSVPALATPGAHSWDVGPFGHHDLFGNAREWIRPYRTEGPSKDPLLDGEWVGPGEPRPDERVASVAIWTALFALPPGAPAAPNQVLPVTLGARCREMARERKADTGFRCAFP